jgi:hypothetical protein
MNAVATMMAKTDINPIFSSDQASDRVRGMMTRSFTTRTV